ncbi:ParB family protein [Providencia rettgeri]|uniref:ParB/RepB/Spo0J family partition protein n=1 Tax=Providencia rettgeri TaxID=587 RepID=A0AAW6UIW5_PRORE|nr:ParB/RepB/Spo0J family partition protein [Providencia rettgeri]
MTQKKPREVLGRTFSESPLSGINVPLSAASGESLRFVLKSGRKVMFQTETITAEQVETRTYVDPKINGRDQNALTQESLADITSTLQNQQFFPAIGRLVEGRIEILDGSRRRAAALLCGVGLRVMYTKSEMTAEEARQLAAEIQTAKEHNIREVGMTLIAMRDQGITQKDIAERQNMSTAAVSRAIQAATVPEKMVSVFPIQSLLVFADYKILLNISIQAEKKKIDIDTLVANVGLAAKELEKESLQPDLYKERVMKLFESNFSTLENKPVIEKPVFETLKEYDDKRKYARKKSDTRARKFTYEFSRISKEAHEKIDAFIRSVIEEDS